MKVGDTIYILFKEKEQHKSYPILNIRHNHIEKCEITDIREMTGKMYSYSETEKFYEISYLTENGIKMFFKTRSLDYIIVDGAYFMNEDDAMKELERRKDDEKRYRKAALAFFRKSLIFKK